MMDREREQKTLNFEKLDKRGAVEETFYPWHLTIQRFREEGIPDNIVQGALENPHELKECEGSQIEKYFAVKWGKGVMDYEQFMGFDQVRRIHFVLPFRRIKETIIKDANDWKRMKEYAQQQLEEFFSEEKIREAYEPLAEGHNRGDYSIRLNVEGFFWVPRELLGIEEHLLAFYDAPELIHDINSYVFEIYSTRLLSVIDIVKPDVLYYMEDLSGKNGPMISPTCFEEFIGAYYKRLNPLFKAHGVGNIFVDTDGNFEQLIPCFLESGIDGFLPMDVNAGMDIVKIREKYPKLKFIGGFNKLEIAKGKEAIDKEFERILPVIRQGGFIPGSDHQIAPSTSLPNYLYYIQKLKDIMIQAGADLQQNCVI